MCAVLCRYCQCLCSTDCNHMQLRCTAVGQHLCLVDYSYTRIVLCMCADDTSLDLGFFQHYCKCKFVQLCGIIAVFDSACLHRY